MSGKTISTSTLSLRFMQNAQRAKSMKEVELEKAAVHDDAQWDIGQEVREAWGLFSIQDASQNVTCEASYLPFLFSDAAEDADPVAPVIPTGRRKFTNGVEDDPTEEQEPEEAPAQEPQQTEKPARSRVHPNPIPIQSVSGKLLGGLQPLKSKTSKESKSAREVIFDNSGVGTDIRSISSSKRVVNEPSSTGFLKPLGVDAPSNSKRKHVESIDGTPKKHKRQREGSDEVDESKKKSKKKKQQVT